MSRGHLAAALAAAVLTLVSPAAASANSFPLKGWWPLNDGSGQTVRDWSGQGNNGFLGSTSSADANDPAWIRGVFLGSALRFDGTDDFVTIPDSPDLEPQKMTVAAWVRNNGTPGNFRYIMGKGAYNCTNSSWGLYTGPDGGLGFYIADSSEFYRSPLQDQSIWDGQWHHIAFQRKGTTLLAYTDGAPGVATTAVPTVPLSSASPLLLGRSNWTCCPYRLQGAVDDVRIYSRALSATEIQAVMSGQ